MTSTAITAGTPSARISLRILRQVGALGLTATLAACSSDKLDITNPNFPASNSASGLAALQQQATGLLRQLRNGRGAFITSTGRFGRELFVYTPQEGRNTSAYLIGLSGQNRLDPAGFAVDNWATQYGNLRDILNFKNQITNTRSVEATFGDAQANASLGFAKTLEALELLYVLSTRDTLGIVVQINASPDEVAPFVTRDSAYRYILGTLDEANTLLSNGGTAFPFTLHTGFAGFNTPTTFRQFNRAITARAAAYYATSGGGTAAWQRALTALSASFLNENATTRTALDVGVFHVYSGATGDAITPLSQSNNTDLYAHPSTETDAPRKADGTLDNRYLAKVGTRTTRSAPQGLGIASSIGFNLYPTTSTPIPIIRNEELILLKAEALLATGDKAGAITLIDRIRTGSGGLAASGLTATSADATILTELLLQKRYSLLAEGHRWIDLRRYGRLDTLPRDITTGVNAHFIARVQPIPQAECLVRRGLTGALAGPGCAP